TARVQGHGLPEHKLQASSRPGDPCREIGPHRLAQLTVELDLARRKTVLILNVVRRQDKIGGGGAVPEKRNIGNIVVLRGAFVEEVEPLPAGANNVAGVRQQAGELAYDALPIHQ